MLVSIHAPDRTPRITHIVGGRDGTVKVLVETRKLLHTSVSKS